MSSGFEQPPLQDSEKIDRAPSFEFSGRSLADIFTDLRDLNRRGETVKGSSSEYTARDLGVLAIDAIRAMDRCDYEREMSLELKAIVKGSWEGLPTLPPPDYESLPEVKAVTRSNGLRAALIEARRNESRGFKESTPFNSGVLEAFREMTGRYP